MRVDGCFFGVSLKIEVSFAFYKGQNNYFKGRFDTEMFNFDHFAF